MEDKDQSINRQATKLKEGYQQVEQQRVEGYQGVSNLMENKQAAQTRERDRLARKYGETHPRVTKLDQSKASNTKLTSAVRSQQSRAENPIPDLQPASWQLYGKVTDGKGNPMDGLVISLFGPDGKWVRVLGYACTNASGYFRLTVENGELIQKLANMPLILTVTDGQRRVLYREAQALTLKADESLVRLIVLEEKACVAPDDIQEVAVDAPIHEESDQNAILLMGEVKSLRHAPLGGVTVKAVAQSSDGDCDLGKEVVTDDHGRYEIRYQHSEFEGKRPNIVLSVYDASGKNIHRSEVYKEVSPGARIDITIG